MGPGLNSQPLDQQSDSLPIALWGPAFELMSLQLFNLKKIGFVKHVQSHVLVHKNGTLILNKGSNSCNILEFLALIVYEISC